MLNIAILFWFYKELEICENRLQILRKSNPGVKIYGLYGGPLTDEDRFINTLSPYLDDFYTSPKEDAPVVDDFDTINTEINRRYGDPVDSMIAERYGGWKWNHGDLVILDWYESRGKSLSWDSIAITQWDMLVFDSIQSIVPGIQEGEIFLSGLRDLTKLVESKWWHTSADEKTRENYRAFFEYANKTYDYQRTPPLCCQFIFEVFPRQFFDKYATVLDKELGMLEYKIPTYADVFKIPFYKKDIGVAWEDLEEDFHNAPMNSSPRGELSESYIRKELKKPDGWRMFHPYSKLWPLKKS